MSETPGAGAPRGDGQGSESDPEGLLGEMAELRRRARTARHAYWFPLVLFGLLTVASSAFYVLPVRRTAGSGVTVQAVGRPAFPALAGLPVNPGYDGLGYYWAVALLGGLLLTLLWYRRHAGRAGVQTRTRGFTVTIVVLLLLVAVLPLLARLPGLGFLNYPVLLFLALGMLLRGLAPFVIAAGLWVLVRAERSRALAVIAAIYTAAALLCGLYNVENVLFRLGWNPSSPEEWQLTSLPSVLTPALVLLAGGIGALAVQRRRATVKA